MAAFHPSHPRSLTVLTAENQTHLIEIAARSPHPTLTGPELAKWEAAKLEMQAHGTAKPFFGLAKPRVSSAFGDHLTTFAKGVDPNHQVNPSTTIAERIAALREPLRK